MRSLFNMAAGLAAIGIEDTSHFFDMLAPAPMVWASAGPIHHRGRFKPKARQEAHRRAKRIGKRRQQGRPS